jgi:hypothetical protein
VLYPETLAAVKAALARAPGAPRTIPIVTGFLGRGINTGVQPPSFSLNLRTEPASGAACWAEQIAVFAAP